MSLEQCSYPASQGERLPEKGVCREDSRGGRGRERYSDGTVRVLDSARTEATLSPNFSIHKLANKAANAAQGAVQKVTDKINDCAQM